MEHPDGNYFLRSDRILGVFHVSSTHRLPFFDNRILSDMSAERAREMSLQSSLEKDASVKQANVFRVDMALETIWKSDAQVMRRLSRPPPQELSDINISNNNNIHEMEFGMHDVFDVNDDILHKDGILTDMDDGDIEMQAAAAIVRNDSVRMSDNPLLRSSSKSDSSPQSMMFEKAPIESGEVSGGGGRGEYNHNEPSLPSDHNKSGFASTL
jgi:hypothetical protein